MKRIILSAVVAVAVVTTSMAQEIPDRATPKHEMKRRHHHGEAFKNLNLTEDQKAQFKALNEENRKQMAELKKNDNITVKELNSKKDALRKDYREKMQSLLTPEQKTQLEKSKLERKTKMEERSKARMEKMKTSLGLSDDQSAKLQTNHAAMQEKMKAIREDKSLNDEAKKEQVKELLKKQKEDMRSTLTEEQLKKLDEQKQKRGSHKKIV
ncbi:MAG: Spy/CpxP family protein refolding chaperone [Chitinophagaceae bacterium]